MELFKDVHFDFLGKKWWFILPSLILTLAGLAGILIKGGLLYGIDFKGGAEMEVRWEGAPPVDRIRATISPRLKSVSVVAAHDLTGSNEVIVSAELPAGEDLASVRQTIVHDHYAILDTQFPSDRRADQPRFAPPSPDGNSECFRRHAPVFVLAVSSSIWCGRRASHGPRRPYHR